MENACNSTEDCKKIPMLRRADRVLLMLDGKRLKVPAERAKVLKSAWDVGKCARRRDADCIVAGEMYFSPVGPSSDDTAAQSPTANREPPGDRVSVSGSQVRVCQGSSRPEFPTASVPLGHGLAEILGDASCRQKSLFLYR